LIKSWYGNEELDFELLKLSDILEEFAFMKKDSEKAKDFRNFIS